MSSSLVSSYTRIKHPGHPAARSRRPPAIHPPGARKTSSSNRPSIIVQQPNKDKVNDAYACMNSVPALSESSTPTTSSTSELDPLDINYQVTYGNALLEDEHGILVAPSLSEPREIISHPCLFAHVFDCNDTYDDVDEWKAHATGHFDTNPPPAGVNCLICKQRFVDVPLREEFEPKSGPGSAWLNMLDHIVDRHSQHDGALDDACPDFELLSYMYCRGILKNEQFRSLQCPRSSPPHLQGDSKPLTESYFCNASSRRERRLRARHVPVG